MKKNPLKFPLTILTYSQYDVCTLCHTSKEREKLMRSDLKVANEAVGLTKIRQKPAVHFELCIYRHSLQICFDFSHEHPFTIMSGAITRLV